LVDAILTPTREPSLLSSQVQQGPGHPHALTAYILALNKLIGENDVMNAETLPKVRMPNRDGFIIRFPDKLSY